MVQVTADNSGLELPELTAKQLQFVYGIKAGMTATDAYKIAYDCEGSDIATIWANASRLRSDSKVTSWLAHTQRQQITAANYTHDRFMADLEELKDLSVKSGNMGAAVNATVNMGKSTGHMVEKQEITHKTNKDELEQALELLQQAGMDVDVVSH
jgi:hypothetical protein